MIAVLEGIFAVPAILAASGDRIVIDADSGLALSGFDPVAYFTDGKPKIGRPGLELRRGDTIWRFRNEGNRAAFAEHPKVYTPRFGGYDPVAVARGVSVPGHPLFWSVTGDRLYLFYSAEARTAFLAEPGNIIEAAERKWPAVARDIGR
ncbi:MAG TPA: YHS domain-containing (seleno)protein [Pseudolabrys sp.]